MWNPLSGLFVEPNYCDGDGALAAFTFTTTGAVVGGLYVFYGGNSWNESSEFAHGFVGAMERIFFNTFIDFTPSSESLLDKLNVNAWRKICFAADSSV